MTLSKFLFRNPTLFVKTFSAKTTVSNSEECTKKGPLNLFRSFNLSVSATGVLLRDKTNMPAFINRSLPPNFSRILVM